jgi:hypothetical protein
VQPTSDAVLRGLIGITRTVARAVLASALTIGMTIGMLAPSRVAAADCPVDRTITKASPSLARVSTTARLRFIRSNMDLGARRSLAWSLGWGITYGAAAVALFTISPFVSSDTRKDLYVGGASAALGAITRAVSRPRVIRERRRLARRVAAQGETCATLHEAEAALARSARWEHRNRRLFIHLAALTYNTGVGLVLGLALDRPLQGIRQATVGAVVGQVMFVTQPLTSARALTRYRAGHVPASGARVQSTPWILPGGGGVGLAGRF